ncbi:PP2C family protein-serine/threonine phosphatase [Streptomyces sp. NPDC007863]|uniref:PP2C family protein-serine/threonine phosphatase n=1 Tax=Streptomyces sp. NPDC007863 TaxID=3154894 RepID=UPI0033E9BF9E
MVKHLMEHLMEHASTAAPTPCPRPGDPSASTTLADQTPDEERAPRRRRVLTALLPALVLVATVVIDVATSEGFRGIVWVALVPGLAALLCGLRTTALYGLLTLGTYAAVDISYPGGALTGLPGLILVMVSAAGALAVCSARLSAARRADHIREIAETTRRTVLRPLPSAWAGLDQAAAYTTADVAARVGGDFYDIQPSAHGTRLVLGDVQGKGLDAVACASALVGSFREAAFHEPDLADVALRMDQRVRRHQEHVQALGGDESERFATAALISFPTSGTAERHDVSHVELVNCGHLTPLAVGPDGVRPLTGAVTLPLGMLGLTGEKPPVDVVAVRPDETLLLVSDGVTEARDADGAFYPLSDDLDSALRADPALSEPRRLVRHVRAAAARHAAHGLTDDTTVLAVRRSPDPLQGSGALRGDGVGEA